MGIRITFKKNPFVFHGAGFLVPIIAVGCVLIANQIVNTNRFVGYADLIYGIGLLVASIATYTLGHVLNKPLYIKVKGKNKNEDLIADEFEVKRQQMAETLVQLHSFYYIPMEIWGVIVFRVAVFILAMQFAIPLCSQATRYTGCRMG